MPIAPGTRLGPYEVTALIGEGGMGEVYKARDTRLDRTVAVKVLPPAVAADPDRRARFVREARAISQLTHPHICTLFDVGREGDTDFLVMEYLEGETLAQRLARVAARTPVSGPPTPTAPTPSGTAAAERGRGRAGRPLPFADTLRIGTELAEALAAAHRAGIVHRDLKPGNVMLTAAGVKVLDFGLAKLHSSAPAADAAAATRTADTLTDAGTRLGTIPYMAPEQVEGKEADARSDLFALGAILYEMATGRRAFEGETPASVAAAILDREPEPVTALQPLAPPAFEHVVTTCLAKDPEARWQAAGDVARELRWVAASGDGSAALTAADKRGTSRRLAAMVIGGIALAAVSLAAGFLLGRRVTVSSAAEPALVRFALTTPQGVSATTDATSAVVSPDGRRLAFVAVDSTGKPRLWIRPLDSLSAQPLPGTENALFPFWSPDSRFIAFFSDGKLRRVPSSGGSADVIADASNGRGGTWSKDGAIVFAPQIMGPLLRVSSDGGEAVEVAGPDSTRHETGLRFPCFLPDGRHFLYVSLPRRQETFDVYVGTLDSKQSVRIMAAGSAPIYAEPGYLLFARGDRLVAQRFDSERLQPVGDVVPLGEAAPVSVSEGAYLLSASATGVLVHAATTPLDTRLVWLDRTGRTLDTIPLSPDRYARPFLSPDDHRAVVTKSSSPRNADLYVVDLERAVASRLTIDGSAVSAARGDSFIYWSPDGGRVAYQCGGYGVCQVATSGAGRPEPLIEPSAVFKDPSGWSPDGKYVIFSQVDQGTAYDLWLLPLQGDRKPVRYLRTPFNEVAAAISPDGRWLAYDSDETGRSEIYVRSFPEPGEKYRISMAEGTRAQWSKDGKELLIFTFSQDASATIGPVYTVDVQTTPTFKAGPARLLFTPRQDLMGLAATSDLKRFLAAVPVEGSLPAGITVLLNWQAALKGR